MSRDNTHRFTGRVQEYLRYRLRYPSEMIDYVRDVTGLQPEWCVADIGAGTGMLAELFLEFGCPVEAIEPNDEMRGACEELTARFPRLRVAKGTAEATGLAPASIDLLSAGRAFHWFDPVASVLEFNRVLRPGGWIVLIASGPFRDLSDVGQAYERVLMEYGVDYAQLRDRSLRGDKIAEFFAGGELHAREYRTPQSLTLEQLAGLTRSYSCAPLAGSAEDAAMGRALEQFFAQWESDGVVTIQATNVLTVGRLAKVGEEVPLRVAR